MTKEINDNVQLFQKPRKFEKQSVKCQFLSVHKAHRNKHRTRKINSFVTNEDKHRVVTQNGVNRIPIDRTTKQHT